MSELFDACVVGAGVIGSASARYLASRGLRTLLLEKFPLPHGRGSSHGQGRIIRHAYDEDTYAKMMPDAFRMWEEIEQEEGTQLLVRNGLLYVEDNESEVQKIAGILKKMNVEHKTFGHAELKRCYPMMEFEEGFTGVLEPSAGTIRADKALRCLQNQFVKFGGIIRDCETVEDVTPGPVITINTNQGQYRTRSLIITAGAWAGPLLKKIGLNLPLQPVRIDVCYWKVDNHETYSADGGFPNTIIQEEGDDIYSLSCLEYPQLIKICNHNGPNVDPDTRDRNNDNSEVNKLGRKVKKHYKGVEGTPSILESCLYTLTPDRNFILDSHPQYNNIVIGAGFSGHGFKMSPVVGKILGQLSQGEKVEYDIECCRMSRFGNTYLAKL